MRVGATEAIAGNVQSNVPAAMSSDESATMPVRPVIEGNCLVRKRLAKQVISPGSIEAGAALTAGAPSSNTGAMSRITAHAHTHA